MNSKKSAFQGLDENENELPEGTYFYVLNILEYPCNETLELQKYCTGTIEVFRN
jgi:hypothetical protein